MAHSYQSSRLHVVAHSFGSVLSRPAGTTPVDRLRREHSDVARLLAALDEQLTLVHGERDADCTLMLEVVTLLTEYVDAVHHAREDRIMAVLVEQDPALRVISDALSAQHDAIAKRGLLLRELLDCALSDEPVARRSLAHLGFAYTAEVRRNMAVEEALVFPLATSMLASDEWAEVEADLDAYAEPLLDEVTARYRDFIDQLPAAGCGCE